MVDLRGVGFPDGHRRMSSVPTAPEPSWKDGGARKEAPFDLRRVKAYADLNNTGTKVWVTSVLVRCDTNPWPKGCPGPVWPRWPGTDSLTTTATVAGTRCSSRAYHRLVLPDRLQLFVYSTPPRFPIYMVPRYL